MPVVLLALLLTLLPDAHGTEQGPIRAQEDREPADALRYTLNAPYNAVSEIEYSVYQGPKRTIAHRHRSEEAPNFAPRTSHNLYISGSAFDHRMGTVRDLAEREVLVLSGAPDAFEEGMTIEEDLGYKTTYKTIDRVEYDLRRGPSDRRIQGRQTQHVRVEVSYRVTSWEKRDESPASEKEVEAESFEHDLWFAPDLPFSIVPFQPLRAGSRVFTRESEALDQYVFEKLRPQLRKQGLLLRMAFRTAGADTPETVLTVSNLERGSTKNYGYDPLPKLDEGEYSRLRGAVLMNEMLRAEADAWAASHTSIQCHNHTSTGGAVFGTNEQGDFALTLRAPLRGDEPADLEMDAAVEGPIVAVTLLRPLHGRPPPHDHPLTPPPSIDWATADSTRIWEDTRQIGISIVHLSSADPGGARTVTISGAAADGTLSIDEASKNRMQGRVRVILDGVRIGDANEKATLELQATFDARRGLQRIGTSKASRVLRETDTH